MGKTERLPAVIFDIDNTIIIPTGRSPFNWCDLPNDKVIPEMRDLINIYRKQGFKIILLTGRPESTRFQTITSLEINSLHYDILLMKQDDPYEKGYISKEKELHKILPYFDIKYVYEDDTKCAEMFKNNNIITFQILNYKFR